MTILTAHSNKSLYPPAMGVPEWPRLELGQRFSDAIEGYAGAVSLAYLVAFGLEPDSSAIGKRARRELDY